MTKRAVSEDVGAYCLICGAGPFTRVGSHTYHAHGVTSREYRKRFPDAAMTGPESRRVFALDAKLHGLRNPRWRVCKYGHALRGDNVVTVFNRTRGTWERRCRKCRNATARRYYHQRKGQ